VPINFSLGPPASIYPLKVAPIPAYSVHTLKIQWLSHILVPKILRPGPSPLTYPLNFPKIPPRPSLQRIYTKNTVSIHYTPPPRPCSHFSFFSLFFSPSTSGRRQNAHKFVSKGGGSGKKCTQIICRKYFPDKINILTYFLINRGRWVYEGGGLEQR